MTPRAALCILSLSAAPAAAQDLPFSPGPTLDCLTGGGGASCVGQAARACIEAAGPGSAGVCTGAENGFWLARIDRAQGQLRAMAPLMAETSARRGLVAPDLEALAQRFAAYRDAACGLRVALWQGMHTGPEEIDCQMRMNAMHALWLADRVAAP